LHAVVDKQKGSGRISNHVLRQLPKVTNGVALALKVVGHSILAYTLKVCSKVATGVIDGRTHQILDILLFRDHCQKC
jgi:hypothetical protein